MLLFLTPLCQLLLNRHRKHTHSVLWMLFDLSASAVLNSMPDSLVNTLWAVSVSVLQWLFKTSLINVGRKGDESWRVCRALLSPLGSPEESFLLEWGQRGKKDTQETS